MKRIGNLYDKIISIENLNLADVRARKNKKKSYGVRLHDRNREGNINDLHEMLKSETFRTSSYSVFKIYEPKEREIYRLPYFPDRIVHHAIMNVMEEIWVKSFTSDTFACIKKRGIQGGMKAVAASLKYSNNTRYCLKIDIKKFYPNVDNEILKKILRRKIKCVRTLRLMDEIIDSVKGVPIGNYLSQYFANFYLSYFDHWIKEVKRVKHYFRYADDMVFLSSSKDELSLLLRDIEVYLRDFLNLRLKDNYQIFPVAYNHKSGRGLDFLGYVFYHSEIRIRKRIKENLVKGFKVAEGLDGYKVYKKAVSGWLGWIKHSKSDYLLNKYCKKDYYEKIKKSLWG